MISLAAASPSTSTANAKWSLWMPSTRNRARRDGLDRRAFGLRKIHAAESDRRPGPPHRAARSASTAQSLADAFRRRSHARAPRQDRIHLSVLQSAADAHLPGKRRAAAASARAGRARKSTSAPASCSTWCNSATAWTTCPTSSRAANGSAWRSRARCRVLTRRSCLPTSPPAISTPTPARRSSALIHDLHDRLNATVLIVTHDRGSPKAARARSRCATRDIVGDVRR